MMTSQQSYQPWHLKYRPQNLSELVGQPLIVRTLTNELKTENLPNVFLFDGPRGTGKTSTARILAKSLILTAYHRANQPSPPVAPV